MEPVGTLAPTCFGGVSFDSRRLPTVLDLETWGMGEVFQVDDLLDFSNGDIGGPIGDDCTTFSDLTHDSSVSEAEIFSFHSAEKTSSRTPGVLQDSAQTSGDPLYVPPDELADQLEWLSTFVEDSYTTDRTLAPLLSLNFHDDKSSGLHKGEKPFQRQSPVSVLEESNAFSGRSCSSLGPTMVVPGRARSKRSRTGGLVWSFHTLAAVWPDRGTGAGKTVSEDFAEDTQSSTLEYDHSDDSIRQKKKANKGTQAKKSPDNSQPRRCTHCQVQKTPQWRAGPLGPKTLCNACGVRYKSGRLVAEYRPAGSPSFVGDIHSNSHKKILEMRRQKDEGLQLGTWQEVPGEDCSTSSLSVEMEELNATDERIILNIQQ